MSWWRFLGIHDQTVAEKRASAVGLNLFFGALIGANLGTFEKMGIQDYTLIITIVCMIVLYLQLAPVARKRWKYFSNLGGLLALLYVLLFDPFGHNVFEGEVPAPHLFVTICLWLVSVATIEFRPIAKNSSNTRIGND